MMKECVAVLTMLYKKNGAVSCVVSDFRKVVVIPGYPVGLDLVMGKININKNCNTFFGDPPL